MPIDSDKDPRFDYHSFIESVLSKDKDEILKKDVEYGASWKKRGGTGAFMMLARKWDRIEEQVEGYAYDIFMACDKDTRPEGIIDDIRDLRRYLILIEAEIMHRKFKNELT